MARSFRIDRSNIVLLSAKRQGKKRIKGVKKNMKMKGKKRILAAAAAVTALCSVAMFAFSGCSTTVIAGKDGKDFNLYEVYQQLVEMDQFSGTYEQFVKQYLNVNVTEKENSTSAVINSTLSSVVSVWVGCEYTRSSGFMMGSSTAATFSSAGSGVIYSIDKEEGDAYIITNCHVVYDSFDSTVTQNGATYIRKSSASELTYKLYLYGMEYMGDSTNTDYPDYSIPFTIVGMSVNNDIAVLKVENSDILKNSLAQAVTVGNSDNIIVGDDVFAVGNPLGEGIAASEGIVSSDSATVKVAAADEKSTISPRAICTSASINEGNSGGGLFNSDGELIGIVFAKNVEDEVEGVGYALPANNAVGVAQSIIDHCNDTTTTTKKAQIGITSYVSDAEQIFDGTANRITNKQTVTIGSVTFGPALGKLQKGDILYSVTLNDQTLLLTKEWQLSEFLWKVRVGDTISLTVLRGNETVTVEITFRSNNFVEVS
jgi:serine protease Do